MAGPMGIDADEAGPDEITVEGAGPEGVVAEVTGPDGSATTPVVAAGTGPDGSATTPVVAAGTGPVVVIAPEGVVPEEDGGTVILGPMGHPVRLGAPLVAMPFIS